MITRRSILGGVASMGVAGSLGSGALAQGSEQWFPLTGEGGATVPNARLPIELTSEVEELPGAVWAGSEARDVTLVEFFDYNCPYCRRAAGDIQALLRSESDLRIGLVNNPILSAKSLEAAKVELALLRLKGPLVTYEFHRRLFERRGVIDGEKALEAASDVGVPRHILEMQAGQPEITGALERQMRLAASLGFATTPSFLIAGAGIFGYPGPASLARIINAVRTCGAVAC